MVELVCLQSVQVLLRQKLNCKQRSSTVSKRAQIVSKKAQIVSKKAPKYNCKQKTLSCKREASNCKQKSCIQMLAVPFWPSAFGSLRISASTSSGCTQGDKHKGKN